MEPSAAQWGVQKASGYQGPPPPAPVTVVAESAEPNVDDPEAQAAVAAKDREVKKLLYKDPVAALKKALESPLLTTKDKNAKDKGTAVVLEVLAAAAKEEQVNTSVDALSLDECDILIKYVYKGLGITTNNGPLFRWHARVVQRAGPGCIVRCINDRKTV